MGSFEDKVKESLQEWEARNEARRLEEATMAATATQAITELQRRIESPHVSKADVVEAEAEINSIKTNLATWFKEREEEEKEEIAKEAHELAVIAEDPDMTDVHHKPHPPQPVDTERVVRPHLVENFEHHVADPVHHPTLPITSTPVLEEDAPPLESILWSKCLLIHLTMVPKHLQPLEMATTCIPWLCDPPLLRTLCCRSGGSQVVGGVCYQQDRGCGSKHLPDS